MSTKEQRKRFKAYCDEHDRRFQAWVEAGYPRLPHTGFLPIPADLVGLTCGAKTRAGTPCKLTSIYRNCRCKYHGGLSTGPKTEEGKKKSSINGKKPMKEEKLQRIS